MTVTLKNRRPLVVPDAVRRKTGLRSGDRIEFQVSGRVISIVPKLSPKEQGSLETVTQVIKEARKNPVSRADLRVENAKLMRYGSRQATKAGVKERDIPRVIHESVRSRQKGLAAT
jgi:bifunctional DNA-binding transcriptional regulator/antitoxin component of YhaV-PrlF toxin-antitoxin module